MPNEKSSSFSVSKRFFWFSVSTEYASDSVSLGVMMSSLLAFTISPSTRILGRSPATRWRSEASFSIISSSNARRLIGMLPLLSGRGFFYDFFERGNALLDLQHAVHTQGQHPFFHREVAQLLGRSAFQDLAAERTRQR